MMFKIAYLYENIYKLYIVGKQLLKTIYLETIISLKIKQYI